MNPREGEERIKIIYGERERGGGGRKREKGTDTGRGWCNRGKEAIDIKYILKMLAIDLK